MSRRTYLIAALILFAIEVLIALFVRDNFIRPYIGDVLAVAFVYTALRAATPLQLIPALTATLAIAFTIEIAQALNFLDAIGLRNNTIARTVLGGVFDWSDLIAYGAGALVILLVERIWMRYKLAP
ncbi:MAG: DUF2809 domain-containing protein [Alphaproteobacteria bacterium]|nr:DUF2809 domain-containing protein [Alphaproteobacteria bacterium]